MIAGLPVETWVLMAVAVVPGVVLVAIAYLKHRSEDASGGSPSDRFQRGEGGDA